MRIGFVPICTTVCANADGLNVCTIVVCYSWQSWVTSIEFGSKYALGKSDNIKKFLQSIKPSIAACFLDLRLPRFINVRLAVTGNFYIKCFSIINKMDETVPHLKDLCVVYPSSSDKAKLRQVHLETSSFI